MTTGLGPDLVFCIRRCSMMRMMWFSTDYRRRKLHEISWNSNRLRWSGSTKVTQIASRIHFYIQQCHLRWRYLLMLTAETARHLLLFQRNLVAGSQLMTQSRSYLREMKQLPNIELLQGFSTHEVRASPNRNFSIKLWSFSGSFWCETQVWGEWFGSIGGWQCKK